MYGAYGRGGGSLPTVEQSVDLSSMGTKGTTEITGGTTSKQTQTPYSAGKLEMVLKGQKPRFLKRARKAINVILQGQTFKARHARVLRRLAKIDIGRAGLASDLAAAVTQTAMGKHLGAEQKKALRKYRRLINNVLRQPTVTASAASTEVVTAPAKSPAAAVQQAMEASRPTKTSLVSGGGSRGGGVITDAISQIGHQVQRPTTSYGPTTEQYVPSTPTTSALEQEQALAELGMVDQVKMKWAALPTWAKLAIGGAAAYAVARQLPGVGRMLP